MGEAAVVAAGLPVAAQPEEQLGEERQAERQVPRQPARPAQVLAPRRAQDQLALVARR